MIDKMPNPDDFTRMTYPGQYHVDYRITGTGTFSIRDQYSLESAEDTARHTIDNLLDVQRKMTIDVPERMEIIGITPVPPRYMVLRNGYAMPVTKLMPGDLPFTPNAFTDMEPTND